MKYRLTLTALFALLSGFALSAGQGAQPQAPPPQTPTFRLQVDYVEVDVLVTDQQGQFVPDLRKEDFRVFEDGKPQTVSTFSLVNIPVERADRPLFAAEPIEPDVESNERPFEGRVYVLVLDDLHTDFLRSQLVKTAARQFIERYLGANDLMAVVTTGGVASGAQEFTNRKRLLLAAVDKFIGRKLEAATLSRNTAFQFGRSASNGRIEDPEDAERGQNARSTLTHLKSVAEWFGGVRGRRKSIVFLSEGIDYDITDVFNNRSASMVMDETRETIAAATRSNVSIYTVDPRGLTTLADDTIGVSNFSEQASSTQDSDPSAAGSAGSQHRPDGIGLRSLMNERRLAQDSLRTLAEETGGVAAVNSNDLGSVFGRIVRDNSGYYVLAYYPPSDRRDGRFHKIEVRVTRPGLTVRARRGYVSPRGNRPAPKPIEKGPSLELLDVLNSPLQVNGLTMRVFAAPFKGTAPNASVAFGVELRGRDLSLAAGTKVELTYLAVDNEGKTRASRTDLLTVDLRPETLARVQATGFRLVNRMDVPAGRYQLRIAARDPASGNAGSVIYDLDVPDYSKLPFSMSGLVLASLASGAMATARADEQLRAVLPVPPTAGRSFPQNDELALFTEIYDDGRAPDHRVDILTTVRSDTGTVVFKNEDERASRELEGQRGGYGYTARIPLTDMPPGPYVLSVEARSRLGNTPPVSREVRFTVTEPVR
jgi:VWFA-related protein